LPPTSFVVIWTTNCDWYIHLLISRNTFQEIKVGAFIHPIHHAPSRTETPTECSTWMKMLPGSQSKRTLISSHSSSLDGILCLWNRLSRAQLSGPFPQAFRNTLPQMAFSCQRAPKTSQLSWFFGSIVNKWRLLFRALLNYTAHPMVWHSLAHQKTKEMMKHARHESPTRMQTRIFEWSTGRFPSSTTRYGSV